MLSKVFVLTTLALTPLVSAHGKVAVVQGNAGGNGTAIGIKGAVVPGPGPNRKTEVDTTVFKKPGGSTNIQTDGLGRTNGGGQNTVDGVVKAMELSGNTLPQVTPGGSITGTFHIVTTDGAGPIKAVLDPTATGKFSQGMMLDVVQQIPGNNGNIKPPKKNQRSLWDRAMEGIFKRAANVNTDHQFQFSLPAGATCNGEVAGQKNVCLVKIANANKAGPFGGVVAIQMGSNDTAAAPAAGAAAGAATGADAGATKATKAKGKTAREFTA